MLFTIELTKFDSLNNILFENHTSDEKIEFD